MKPKNSIWIYSFLVMGFLLLLTTGCDEDFNPDYASEIEGTYYGTITLVGTGSAPASSILSRRSNLKVDLDIKIGGESVSLNRIEISSSEDGIYDLEYSDYSGEFTGEVEGDKLTWTMTAGDATETFSGSR